MSIPVGEQILGAPSTVAVSGTVQVAAAAAWPLFRDSVATVQVTTATAAPAGGATVATVTPGTAGFWEVSGFIWISGTTVAATDTGNIELFQTSTARLNPVMSVVPGTTGMPAAVALPVLVLNLSAADTVNIKAINTATTGSVYTATIVCRRVG